MGRGGKRPGAGRKSIGRLDRELIAARCRHEWQAITEANLLARHKSGLSYEDLEESRAVLQFVPLKYRGTVLNRAKMMQFETDDLPPDIADAVIELRDIRAQLDGRRFVFSKTPQGERVALIARIAAEESDRHGVPISPRQVERWWDTFDFGES